jgi:hypothetical protein
VKREKYAMNEQESVEQLEKWVAETAAAFPYPPAPNVTHEVTVTVRRRLVEKQTATAAGYRLRPAWVVVALLVACLALLAVPQVRAGLVSWFQIGAVRVFVGEPTATATRGTPHAFIPTAVATAKATPTVSAQIETLTGTATPTAVPTITASPTPMSAREVILSLAGATTLAEAQAEAAYPLLLPRYPPNLGRPDHVFRQRQNMGDTIIMLWLEPDRPDEVRLALYQIHVPDYVIKYHNLIEETTVNGRRAIWFEGGHLLQLVDGRSSQQLFVEGNVLLWTDGDVTYRLESHLSLAEALAIAGSLEPAAGNR